MSDHDEPRGSGRGWRGAELIGIVLIALGVIYLLGSFGIIRVAWASSGRSSSSAWVG